MKKLLIIVTLLMLVILPLIAKDNVVITRVNHGSSTSTYSSKAYCAASGNEDEYISALTLNSINGSYGSGLGDYVDRTTTSTDLQMTVAYPISVTNGTAYNGDQCTVWIDWNQNESFYDAGDSLALSGGPTDFTGTITVPATATLGNTRMRVRINYTDIPVSCGSDSWGQIADYTINVTAAPAGPGNPTNPSPINGATDVAIDGNPDISWDNPTGATYNTVYFDTDSTSVADKKSVSKVLGDGSTLYTSYNESSNLTYLTDYFWRVVESDGKTDTDGPVYKFTTTTTKSLDSLNVYQILPDYDIQPSSTDNAILAIAFYVSGNAGTLNLTSIDVTSQNTADADISGVKLYATTTGSFATTTQIGTSQTFSGGVASFTGLTYDLPGASTSYLWVAYDIASGATINDVADASIGINAVTVAGSTYPAVAENPTGSRDITWDVSIGGDMQYQSPYPLDIYYNNSRCQTIYLQSEINVSNKRIEKIRYYASSASDTDELKNTKIWMSHTSLTAFADTAWVGGTLVFDGDLTMPATPGWEEITLDTPFEYNNTDNLIVGIHDRDGSYESTYHQYLMSGYGGDNRTVYGANDSNASPDTQLGAFYPDIQLVFADIPVGAPDPAINPTPTDTATDVARDTNLSWNSGGGAAETGYKIYLGTDNPPTNIENGTDLGLVTSYDPVTDFTYNTMYYWKIVGYNASGDATGSSTWSFTVMADPSISTFPYTNSFEGTFPPTGWSVVDVNGTAGDWTQETATVHPSGIAPQDGTYLLRWNSYTANASNNTRLEMPDCDFTSLSTVIVKFWMYHDTGYSSSADAVQMQVYTGGAWVNVGDPVERYDGTTGWKQHVVDLTDYAGSTVKLGFYGISGYGNDVYIDNMWLGESLVNNNSDVLFSEVCDNDTGADDTGFIELFNKKDYVIDLSGDQINMGTAGNNYNEYTYTIPENTIIAAQGYITIGNGATLTDFNTAWSKSLTTSTYLVGTSSLAITSGKAYAYNTAAKSVIDETPVTVLNGREVRKSDKTWDGTTTNGDGTPGETGTNDEPLAQELVSFMAVYNAEELTVMWTTASEFNLNSWNIYRSSVDNFTDANAIGSVDAQGTSTETHKYVYNDNSDYVVGDTYYYWIESIANDGTVQLFGPTSVTINEHNNPEPPAVITYGVENYPNPFNPRTMIRFALRENEGTNAKLDIYNIKGQFVKELRNGKVEANKYYRAEWDGTDMNSKSVASGVYFYKLTTDKKTFMKKMLLLK